MYIKPIPSPRALAIVVGSMLTSMLWAATITVNSTADTAANDGACTLREAITAANTDAASGALAGECAAGSGADDIVFNIPGLGVKLIATAAPLPVISTPIHVNGYTQPGASANTNGQTLGSNAVLLIEIDHGAVPNNATLTVSGTAATGTIIEGLALSRSANASCCANMGIYVVGADNVWVRGNFFGTDATGTTVKTLQDTGVLYQGTLTGAIVGSNAATLNPAYRNVFSSVQNAVTFSVTGGFNSNVTIRGNLIGTHKSGLAKIAGGGITNGLFLDSLSDPTLVSDNVISGTSYAIRIRRSSGLIIENNLIGFGVDGTTALANFTGVEVFDNPNVNGAIATDITIRNNTIANSTSVGISVHRGTNVNNTVVGIAFSKNVIRNTTGLSIDLYNGAVSDGVTANDSLDVDTGANNLQNFPVLSAATGDGVTVSTPYQFNSEPNQTFALEFFRATTCAANGHGGADVYLGSVNVTTDAAGNASGTASFASASITGVISATATHAVNGTSEFSACAPLAAVVTNALLTLTKSGNGSGTVTDLSNGINCGIDCTEPFPVGALVTLTAVAAPGSVFVGWSGYGCSGTGTCVVTISAASIPPPVNAQFDVVISPVAAQPIPTLGAPLVALLAALLLAVALTAIDGRVRHPSTARSPS